MRLIDFVRLVLGKKNLCVFCDCPWVKGTDEFNHDCPERTDT